MRRLVFLLVCLVATSASAQSTNIGRSGVVTTGAVSGVDLRDFNICLLADMQNVVSAEAGAGLDDPLTDCSTVGYGCTEPYCTKSDYCTVSWKYTAEQFMKNLAYDLTGQWDKIDWTGLVGRDNVLVKPGRAIYHQPCDLVLSLGDMTDVANGSGYGNYVASSAATLDGLGLTYQHTTNKMFWNLVNESGIPWMIHQGNHDPWAWWDELFTLFDIENKLYFYEREPTYGLSYAILVPTGWGKSVCVVGIGFSDTFFDVGAQPNRGADILTWATSVVGCGANHPTVMIGHSQVGEDGEPHSAGTVPQVVTLTGIAPGTYPGTAGVNEIFMISGGHHLTTDSGKTSYTGLFGVSADATVYGYYSNWQETNRHGTQATYGLTEKESNGAWYTIVTLQPDRDRICAHDWSPYWQTPNGGTANGQTAGIGTSAGCQAFDFDTRFP